MVEMKRRERIELLEKQHRELDKKIQIGHKNYMQDHLLKDMKRRKFQLKLEISKLKELDIND
jgi:hypothetical protein